MQAYKSVLFIDIPPLLKIELKESYSDWYSQCQFYSYDSISETRSDIIIIPAEKFVNSVSDSRPTIAYGPIEYLEASFIHGAVDYLKDPWTCSELLIRCRPYLEGCTLHFNEDSISYSNGCILINGRPVKLSPFQCRLLIVLMKNINSFVGYSLLKDFIGIKSPNAEKSIHVHMHHIRSMLKKELPQIYGKSLNIKNSNSLGYALFYCCGQPV